MSSFFWRIVLLCQPYTVLTYKIPSYLPSHFWTKGLRVLVPLGNRLVVGILLEHDKNPSSEIRYKEILWPAQTHSSFAPQYLDVMRELGVRQVQTLGQVLAAVFPVDWKSSAMVFITEDGQQIQSKELQSQSPDQLEALGKEWERGKMQICPVYGREELAFHVVQEPPWPVRPSAKKQIELLEFLWTRGIACFCDKKCSILI